MLDVRLERRRCAGASLHVCMAPHGPDTATFETGTTTDSRKPERLADDSLAFMFEVSLPCLTGCMSPPACQYKAAARAGLKALTCTATMLTHADHAAVSVTSSLSRCDMIRPFSCMQVNYIPRVKKSALMSGHLDKSYQECWAGLKSHFQGGKKAEANGNAKT